MSDSTETLAPDSGPGLGLDEPPQPETAQPYRVLARKYRPQTFSELIGQDAMVQTLGNAIKRDRLAHAFLMTGVRGVGKTSTARLIAKSLNCIGPDGQGGPTIDPCGVCENCRAIAEGRHMDVIEMDAASHTGVDDVREIIEAVRYASVTARYKIYIIDEVHMLSKNAFNALLKTLEEPPPHVKFLFATTEVQKVPITVLSRCQRFDLKRITAQRLAEHFGWVCSEEQVEAEEDALALIAEAAEGSVRDGLSILDQAIAHADIEAGDNDRAVVHAAAVRDMLGLSDRSAVRRIFAHIIAGDPTELLAALDAQNQLGVEPIALVRGLMDLVHRITLIANTAQPGAAVSAEERAALEEWAENLGLASLHRLWQLLLKGHDEVTGAPMPRQAAEMALLRVLHAATMPDPGDLARIIARLEAGDTAPPAASPEPAASPSATAQESAKTSPQPDPESPAPEPEIASHTPPVSDTPPWKQETVEQETPAASRTSATVAQDAPSAAPAVSPTAPAELAAPVPNTEPIRDDSASAVPQTFEAMVDALEEHGKVLLVDWITALVRPIALEPGRFVYQSLPGLPGGFDSELIAALNEMTGMRWQVEAGAGEGAPSLKERRAALNADARDEITRHPLVRATLDAFPDAEIVEPQGGFAKAAQKRSQTP